MSTTKALETSAIDIFDTDNAHVALDGARVKASAEGGEVSGVKLEKVALPDTASLTLSNGAKIDVSGGAAFGIEKGDDPEGEANGALISQAKHGEVRLSGASTITVSTSSSLKDADAGSDGVEITRTEAAEVALSGMSSINAQASSSGLGGSAYISGLDTDHIKTLSISLDDASKVCGTGTASQEKGHAGVSGIEIDEVQDIEVGLSGQSQLRAVATGQEAVATAFHCVSAGWEGSGDPTHATVVLDEGAKVVGEAAGAYTQAGGIILEDSGFGAIKGNGGSRITVTANAAGDMVSAMGIAAMDGGEDHGLDVTLSRGSQIKAEVSRGSGGFADDAPRSAAIVVPSGTITVDETSSLQGEWSVFRQETSEDLREGAPRTAAPVLALNNKGLVKGRLSGVVLDNASTGILQADFNASAPRP